jgi:glycosyltransferase involved in cell wall biosynthesis
MNIPSVITLRDCMSFDYGQFAGNIDPNDLSRIPSLSYSNSLLRQLARARTSFVPFRNWVIKSHLSNATARVAISNELRRALAANGITDVRTIHNGMKSEQYRWKEDCGENFRVRHQIHEKKIILWCGRLSKNKGWRQALAMLRHLKQQKLSVVLLVLTRDCRELRILLETAKMFGLADSVRSLDWLDRKDIVSAYRASTLVIYPSIYLDAFGRVVLEAMMCNRPVVATCFGGAREIVEDGVTGFIVNPFDVSSFAEKVRCLLVDENLANRMGKAGRARALTVFSLEKIAMKYLALFGETIPNEKE